LAGIGAGLVAGTVLLLLDRGLFLVLHAVPLGPWHLESFVGFAVEHVSLMEHIPVHFGLCILAAGVLVGVVHHAPTGVAMAIGLVYGALLFTIAAITFGGDGPVNMTSDLLTLLTYALSGAAAAASYKLLAIDHRSQ
jgi:hypothetical protein